jgi:hypothetical protein
MSLLVLTKRDKDIFAALVAGKLVGLVRGAYRGEKATFIAWLKYDAKTKTFYKTSPFAMLLRPQDLPHCDTPRPRGRRKTS